MRYSIESTHNEDQLEEVSAESETSSTAPNDVPAPTLLELLLDQKTRPPPLASHIEGVVIGRIASIDPSGQVRVTFPGTPAEGFAARLTTPIHETDRGRDVALMFERGDPTLPIIMGKMVSPLVPNNESEATSDGRRIEISAEEEVVLRCGESSITLTRSGKIIIRGSYVLSRSSGVNRIQGGSVEIN